MIKRPDTKAQRIKRHKRVRAKVSGTPERPRLNVFRSEKNIYAQIIDDVAGNTLVAASSLDKAIEGNGSNKAAARAVGKLIAERAKAKGIDTVVFDRGGYIYTGRVAQHGLTIASMPAVDEINRLSNTVNEQCVGLSLSKSAETVRSIAASAGYESVRGVADALADAFESMALDERADELYMSGTSHLAHSRSLADLAPLFDALEEQVVLMKLMSNLSEETNASGVGVAIGSEMHTPGLLHASVVSSGYGRSGAAGEPAGNDPVGEPETESETESQTNDTEPIAFVGSIGPTHMDYAATMAAVRAVARYLTAFLSEGRTQD